MGNMADCIGVSPGAVDKRQLIVTRADLDERVAKKLDRAIQAQDYAYFQSLSRFNEVNRSLSKTAVAFNFHSPAEMAGIYAWCKSEFGDCIAGITVQLVLSGHIATADVSRVQTEYSMAVEARFDQILRPISVAPGIGANTRSSQPGVVGVLRIEGKAFCEMINTLQQELSVRAGEYADSIEFRGSAVEKIRGYLNSQMTKAFKSVAAEGQHERKVDSTEDKLKSLTTPNVSLALVSRLETRLEALKRRTGLSGGGLFGSDHATAIQVELNNAILDGDTLDIAACASLMWEYGLNVKTTKAMQRTFEQRAELPNTKGNSTTSSVSLPSAETLAENKDRKTGELLTTEQLAERIKYDVRTIRERLLKTHFIKDVHYIQPFGRKILYYWDEVKALMSTNGVAL